LDYGQQQIGLLQDVMSTPLVTETQSGQQTSGLGDVLVTGAQLLATQLMVL